MNPLILLSILGLAAAYPLETLPIVNLMKDVEQHVVPQLNVAETPLTVHDRKLVVDTPLHVKTLQPVYTKPVEYPKNLVILRSSVVGLNTPVFVTHTPLYDNVPLYQPVFKTTVPPRSHLVNPIHVPVNEYPVSYTGIDVPLHTRTSVLAHNPLLISYRTLPFEHVKNVSPVTTLHDHVLYKTGV